MKTTLLLFNRFVVSIAGISLATLLLPQLSWAQNTNVNPLQDLQPQNNSDPFSPNYDGGNSSNGIFDLIHRAQLGTMRDYNEVAAEQNASLDAAADQFRKLQQQRLQQTQPTPANSVTTPQPSN